MSEETERREMLDRYRVPTVDCSACEGTIRKARGKEVWDPPDEVHPDPYDCIRDLINQLYEMRAELHELRQEVEHE